MSLSDDGIQRLTELQAIHNRTKERWLEFARFYTADPNYTPPKRRLRLRQRIWNAREWLALRIAPWLDEC